MSYSIEFTLPGLPKMSNQLLRGHWRTKHGHTKVWKRKTWRAVWPCLPPEPLERAVLTITRCSSVRPDYDGLVSSAKCIIDGLVEAGVLANDKHENIQVPIYTWEQAPRGKGCMRIKVEAA